MDTFAEKRKLTMNYKVKVFTCLVMFTGMLSLACDRGQLLPAEPVFVRTELVEPDNGRNIVTYPGRVKPGAEANAAFRVAGTISFIPVEVGDFVKKGQTIAILDDRDYRTQLEATQAEYDRVSADANRVIELFKRGSASASENDKATYGLQQITAKLEAHKNALADTRLKAPFDGYVQKRMFEPGETVGAGMQVISLVGSKKPEIEINIAASDFIRRKSAISYTARVDAIPGKEFPMEVTGVAPKGNLNQLYTVRLKFLDEKLNELLTPGMTADVIIKFAVTNNDRFTIPLSALVRDKGKCYVWVIKNGKVSKRPIEIINITGDGKVVATSGLNNDYIIVTAGIHSLKEGMQVRQLDPMSVSNLGNIK